ncbi:MAG: IS5 family transposase [Gammaproteobacteria bacterium]
MRGTDEMQEALFTTVHLESFVPQDHPLRGIRILMNDALQGLDGLFGGMYAECGRESIPPEHLLRAQLLQVLYSIRSERQLCEQLQYNLLFRWFVGLPIEEAAWEHSTFSKNRDRLLEHAVIPALFAEVVGAARRRGLLSEEHFSVDGTLIQAWASHKSFRRKDGPPPGGGGHNKEVDFHGESRTHDTYASVTDPDARLLRKSKGSAAILCYQGHTVMENRHGLIVAATVSHATGLKAEWGSALALLGALPGARRKTVGADKGYDTTGFIQGCREQRITAHVARKIKGSAVDTRTTRHPGYRISQLKRKRIEEPFGWAKHIGPLRQVKQRGVPKVNALFQFAMLGWNLVRMRTILALNTG